MPVRGLLTAAFALAALLSAAQLCAEPETVPVLKKRSTMKNGEELIGTPARPWRAEHWINSPPLQLSDLRGRVVLLRFWTAPDCPYCSATAPALNELHRRYAARGLSVIGFYHHKAPAPLDPADVAHYAKLFGFQFPVAIDLDWATLRDYWLDKPRSFTSASFLIDRGGIIRFIHPGGQYASGEPVFEQIDALIQRLCAEPG